MRHQEKLKDKIIELLSPGPSSLPALVGGLSTRYNISVQAVYKMLRTLRKQEIISIHSKQASLSLIWTIAQKEKYAFIEQSYKASAYIKNLIEKKVNRSTFTFKTLNELELFWTHVYTLIAESVNSSLLSYSIQPHDWYPYSRAVTSNFWEAKHKGSGRRSRFIVTHTTNLDKEVLRKRKQRQGNLIEYVFNHNPLKQENNIYYNLLGDFVFKAEFDKKVATELNTFIETNPSLPLSTKLQKLVGEILSRKGKFILTIYKSQTKATNMEKKVKKFFE